MKRIFLMISILLLLTLAVSSIPTLVSSAQAASETDLYQFQGKVVFMSAIEQGTGYGPPTDFIDVEAVIRLDAYPDNRFGLKLHDDAALPTHTAMFELLRDAVENNYTVIIDVAIPPGKQNGTIIRVAVIK